MLERIEGTDHAYACQNSDYVAKCLAVEGIQSHAKGIRDTHHEIGEAGLIPLTSVGVERGPWSLALTDTDGEGHYLFQKVGIKYPRQEDESKEECAMRKSVMVMIVWDMCQMSNAGRLSALGRNLSYETRIRKEVLWPGVIDGLTEFHITLNDSVFEPEKAGSRGKRPMSETKKMQIAVSLSPEQLREALAIALAEQDAE